LSPQKFRAISSPNSLVHRQPSLAPQAMKIIFLAILSSVLGAIATTIPAPRDGSTANVPCVTCPGGFHQTKRTARLLDCACVFSTPLPLSLQLLTAMRTEPCPLASNTLLPATTTWFVRASYPLRATHKFSRWQSDGALDLHLEEPAGCPLTANVEETTFCSQ
jgi:hypothetical protein